MQRLAEGRLRTFGPQGRANRWMRYVVAAAALCGFGACAPGGEREAERPPDVYVEGVPLTLRALREYAQGEGWRYEEETITRVRGSSMSACGHSPICILVPIADAWRTLFPRRYKVATASSEGGRVEMQGAFDGGDGALIYLRVRDGDEWRDVRALELPNLGRRPIVEVGRITILPDGGDGPERRTPILSQVNLRPGYERALAMADSEQAWGRLIVEVLRQLGDEMKGWAQERLRAADTSDDQRLGVVYALCRGADTNEDEERHVVDALLEDASADLFAALLECDTQRARLVQALRERLCAPDRDPSEYTDACHAAIAICRSVREDPTACSEPRETWLRLWADGPVEAEAIARALEEDAYPDAYVRLLRRNVSAERGILLARVAAAQTPQVRQVALASLCFGDFFPAPRELALIAEVFREQSATAPDDARVDGLASVMWILSRAGDPALRAMAREVLADDPDLSPEQRQRLAAGRVLLRDRGSVAQAIAGIAVEDVNWSRIVVPTPAPNSTLLPPGLDSNATLVAWTLALAGCRVEEVREALTTQDSARAEGCIASAP